MAKRKKTELPDVVDSELIKGLGQRFRDSIDEALTRGASPAQLLYTLRQLTGGKTTPKGGLVYLGVEAYLHSKSLFKGDGSAPPALEAAE